MRRTLNDILWSAGALVMLVVLLVATDPRVRDEVSVLGHGKAPSGLVAVGNQAQNAVTIVMAVVRDQTQTHAVLMLFVVAATLLTLFMVRT